MGWLSNIFKPQKPPDAPEGAQSSELGLDDLIVLLEKKLHEKNLSFENDLREHHRKMTDSMREFSKALSELLSSRGPDKIDPALMKVARSYSSSMDKAFNAVRTDFEKDVTYTLEDFESYFKRCSSSIGQAELDVARYISPLKEIFPGEMRSLLKKSERMNEVIAEVKSKLERKVQDAKPYSDALSAAKNLRLHVEKTVEAGLQLSEAKSTLADLERKKSELEQTITDLLRGEKWKEHQAKLASISELEKKRDSIRTFVVQTILPIDRAMKKLKKIRADLGKRIENEEVFDLYINDPVEAFLKDTGQKVLNTTVLQIKDIFEKISPDPDSRKDQKIKDSIAFLESGEVMRNARRDYDEIEQTISRLQSELRALGARESKARLDEDLKRVAGEIPQARDRLEKLESLYSKLSETKSDMLSDVKLSAGRVLGEQIRIQPLN